MPLHVDALGVAGEAHTATITVAAARAYAAATNDDNPVYESGAAAPPVLGVVPTWPAMTEAMARIVPAEALLQIVHGEQDMWFHRPLVPGMTLVTRATPWAVRVSGTGSRATIHATSVDGEAADAGGRPVLEQYVTVFVRGLSDGEAAGPDKPGHSFPREARARLVGEHKVHVDDDQTFRYRDASGDDMPIHTDDEVARSVGLPGIIAHGLCTMAMCSQAVVRTVAGGDPSRLRRLAVRFSKPVFPGDDVVTTVYDAGPAGEPDDAAPPRRAFAFEAATASGRVVKDGWAEVEA
jgi:acyl dehydratase